VPDLVALLSMLLSTLGAVRLLPCQGRPGRWAERPGACAECVHVRSRPREIASIGWQSGCQRHLPPALEDAPSGSVVRLLSFLVFWQDLSAGQQNGLRPSVQVNSGRDRGPTSVLGGPSTSEIAGVISRLAAPSTKGIAGLVGGLGGPSTTDIPGLPKLIDETEDSQSVVEVLAALSALVWCATLVGVWLRWASRGGRADSGHGSARVAR
jgi:hypothetical protein